MSTVNQAGHNGQGGHGGTPIQVLLVEDNPGDIRLTIEAFTDARVHLQMCVVKDGEEAMRFLHQSGMYAASPRPDLILLDLNLPKKDGREVLAEIKTNPSLMTIPVVILTTSASDIDIEHSYAHHANCYIAKPVDLEGFLTVVRSIDDFWLTLVKLPHLKGAPLKPALATSAALAPSPVKTA